MDLDAGARLTAGEQISDLRTRVAQNPGNPAPRNKLAAVLEAEGMLDEAVGVLQTTIDRFPNNIRAQERLRALLATPAEGLLQQARPAAAGLMPALAPIPAIEALPVSQEMLLPQPEWSLVQEPRNMPIRLARWRPTAELISSFSIILVLGIVWEAWRLLPESHLLQKPAAIVTEAAIPPFVAIAFNNIASPAPVFIHGEVAPPAPPAPHGVAPIAAPALPEAVPQTVMILYDRHGVLPRRAASRLAARLQADHLAVGMPIGVAEAGQPGIGYFYAEDRGDAEALQRQMPDFPAGVRLISGAARTAQQPGAVAIVIR